MKMCFIILLILAHSMSYAQQDTSKIKKAAPAKKQQTEEQFRLKTLQDKMSYVIGYDVGQKMILDMSSKNLDFNMKVFLKAVQDAFEGSKPALSDMEARNVLTLFDQLMKAAPEERKKLQQQMFEKK